MAPMEPSDDMLRGLLSAAPDALLAVDGGGRIVYVNDQAASLFGWERAELVGRPVEELVPERFSGHHADLRAGYMTHPVRRPMGAGLDLWARRQDGTEFPAEISLSSIDTPDGRLVAAAVRDVTDRLILEEQRREQALASQRERSARLESLGQLAGGIAHDFNNLLGVIVSYASLVATEIDSPEALEDLAEIRMAAERGAGLTRQLLMFARRDVPQAHPLELNEVVSGVATMLGRTLGEQVHVALDLAEERLVALADRHQVEQIVLNLAINARDAMPEGGHLTIITRSRRTPASQDEESGVLLQVRDTGVGMDAEVLAHAVEPFFTTKPRGQGSGLGLATVHGIVASHNGALTLESEPGHGTTVTVRLPFASDEPAGDRPSPGMPGGSAGRILLVEDERPLRRGTARLLQAHGYEVVTAEDGQHALDLVLSGNRFDLVITDLVMPRMRGDELARGLSAAGVETPVLFTSGYDSGDVRDLPGPLLIKPVSESDLFQAVTSLVSRSDAEQ